MRAGLFWVLCALVATLALATSCDSIQALLQNPKYIYDNGAVLVDGNDRPIELANNSSAVNVSYADLLAFVRQDPTDQIQYVDRDVASRRRPFVCADFAEAVHNNAEAAGIRAGYVSLDWHDGTIGHAIDVFETTDRGTVFIDCTGRSRYSQVEDGDGEVVVGSWDKVAYVEVGRDYGVIGLDYALSPDYAFYVQYAQKWLDLKQQLADYNSAVRAYNQEIAGKVFREGSLELQLIKAQEANLTTRENELNALTAEIGNSRFRPLGVVKTYSIHW